MLKREAALQGVISVPTAMAPKQNPDRTISDKGRLIWDATHPNQWCPKQDHPPALQPKVALEQRWSSVGTVDTNPAGLAPAQIWDLFLKNTGKRRSSVGVALEVVFYRARRLIQRCPKRLVSVEVALEQRWKQRSREIQRCHKHW